MPFGYKHCQLIYNNFAPFKLENFTRIIIMCIKNVHRETFLGSDLVSRKPPPVEDVGPTAHYRIKEYL